MQKWDIVEGASGWLRCKALRLKVKEEDVSNTHFGYSLEGASEWLRCKALRMRAQGVY